MKYRILLLLTLVCFAFSINAQQVSLKGKLLNFGKKTVQMQYFSLEGAMENSLYQIELNDADEFEFSFELQEPAYFKLGRTYMYLSPGDELMVTIDLKDRATAKFKGIGAEANLYLRNLPYPKGGSFINEFLKEDISPADIVALLKDKVSKLEDELDDSKNLSKDFVALEKARLQFEFANSLLMYKNYASYYLKGLGKDELNKQLVEADEYFTPYIANCFENINNEQYLDFEVFKSFVFYANNEWYRKKYNVPVLNSFLQEYLKVYTLIMELERKGVNNQILTRYDNLTGEIKSEIFINALEKKFNKLKNLSQGNKAVDLTFVNIKDETIKLSDFRGNLIVVDLWATWCGPCMKEMPFFEKLKEKFGDEKVKFLSVSIDKNSTWKKYLTKHKKDGIQLQIDRNKLEHYNIVGIPRFFVISPNMEIIDVFAPKPSSGKLEELIRKKIE